MNCIACGNESFHIKTVNWHPIRKCVDCLLEFCWPMPTEDALAKFYAGYRDPLASDPVQALNTTRKLQRMGVKGGESILDFGCGAGAFVYTAIAKGMKAYGVDKHCAPCGADPGEFQWVTMWGVLEHLTDPIATLRSLPANRIALTTVSTESRIPYRHKPPEHTPYFTRASIMAIADAAGFEVTTYAPYRMEQDSDVYLDTLLRTMPDEYQAMVTHSLPKYVEIPTNEVFVVLEKCQLH